MNMNFSQPILWSLYYLCMKCLCLNSGSASLEGPGLCCLWNAAFVGCIWRSLWIGTAFVRCCDVIGIQMQPLKDANPELRQGKGLDKMIKCNDSCRGQELMFSTGCAVDLRFFADASPCQGSHYDIGWNMNASSSRYEKALGVGFPSNVS